MKVVMLVPEESDQAVRLERGGLKWVEAFIAVPCGNWKREINMSGRISCRPCLRTCKRRG